MVRMRVLSAAISLSLASASFVGSAGAQAPSQSMSSDPTQLLQSLSDEDLLRLLLDEDEVLRRRISAILENEELLSQFTTPPEIESSDEMITITYTAIEDPLDKLTRPDLLSFLEPVGLEGIYFIMSDPGYGHHRVLWGRFTTTIGGRNYNNLFARNPVGDLFRKGANDFNLEIWTPTYGSPTGISYHVRLELYFDPAIFTPGGVVATCEKAGVLRFAKEGVLKGCNYKITIN